MNPNPMLSSVVRVGDGRGCRAQEQQRFRNRRIIASHIAFRSFKMSRSFLSGKTHIREPTCSIR
jgi:hypothetical protein